MKPSTYALGIVLAAAFLATTAPAALLTSFSDDFNRPDGPLGSNYTLDTGAAYTISNNQVLLSTPTLDLTSLNVGTLPTALDFANGYSFTASLDVLWTNASATQLEGLLLNYSGTDNYLAIALRGDDNLNIQARGRKDGVFYNNVPINAIAFTDNTWYTLTVHSATAGVYDVSLSLQGSGSPLRTGTVDLGSNTLTGGTLGFYGSDGGSNNMYDNLSVTVIPEPSTLALTACGVLGLASIFRRRKNITAG